MHLELRCRLEYFILESGKRHSLRGYEYKLVQAETNGSHVVASVCFFFVFFCLLRKQKIRDFNWHTHSYNGECIDALQKREHVYLSST